jgi:hypothetical protein
MSTRVVVLGAGFGGLELQYCSTSQGHRATGELSGLVWQAFFRYCLQEHPIEFDGYQTNHKETGR